MTLAMPDSVRVADLPPGYDAYLGYVDGKWATARELVARFPAARLVLLTVTGATLDATGIDCEPGNVGAADARVWVQRKLARDPGSRPVLYGSVEGEPGFGMPDVLAALKRNGIARSSVRLLSAHYGKGPHVCSPAACGATFTADGTQWTDFYLTPAGAVVDMSMLAGGFFGQPETETERIVRELGIVRQGDSGEAVKTVQRLCNGRPHYTDLIVDGVFGTRTNSSVILIQLGAGIVGDGVVGPQTWPVLLGVAG
jgi:hypothetical protein